MLVSHFFLLACYICFLIFFKDKWERYANSKETLELFEHVSLMTLDSILKCAFSCNSNCQTEGWETLTKITISASASIQNKFRCFINKQKEDITFHVSLLFSVRGTNAYIKAVYELTNLINLRMRMFPYHSDLIFHLSPHGFRYRKAYKVAHSHTGKPWTQRHLCLI